MNEKKISYLIWLKLGKYLPISHSPIRVFKINFNRPGEILADAKDYLAKV